MKFSKVIGALALWEFGWWIRRRALRQMTYANALARARELGRPLAIVGAPDRGPTAGYPPGDVTIDYGASNCPDFYQLDITKPLPFEDNSLVVFVSCVLEYVDDYASALRELERVSGGEWFNTRVEPWTFTAYLYPGAKRTTPVLGRALGSSAGLKTYRNSWVCMPNARPYQLGKNSK